jgi:protocatechuate 3,4-dioxygenase beta subunit
MRTVAGVAILSTIALLARAQTPRDRPATVPQTIISGRVVAAETGDPIPNARVTMTPFVQGAPVVLTDREGRFSFDAPAGRHRLAGTKVGYAREEVGLSAAGEPVEIRLPPAAAISGRIVDSFGEPVTSTRVVVETGSPGRTEPTVVRATETDDRGEYRLGGLSPGDFFVAVMAVEAGTVTLVVGGGVQVRSDAHKIYYPGTASTLEAEPVHVETGEDRPNVDVAVPVGLFGGMPFQIPLARELTSDPTAPATSVIRGRVVSTDGRALAHAQVRLFPDNTPFPTRSIDADADGRFEFAGLNAGRFRIGATKPGYITPAPNGAVIPGVPMLNAAASVDVGPEETRDRVDVVLAPLGTLSGEVFDELGEPVDGASVQMLRVRYEAGRRRLVPVGTVRLTDDRGRYRLFNLPPGQYIVSAAVGAVGSADTPGYVRSYFPGTSDPSLAQFVSVDTSRETVGIDIGLVRTRTARIAGQVLDAAGEPSMRGSLQLKPSLRSPAVTSVPLGARIDDKGVFEFPNVPPGQYVIQADRGRSNGSTEGEFGTLAVSVDGTDVTDLTLQTSSGSSIRGNITFDAFNGTRLPEPSRIEISPLPVDTDAAPRQSARADIHTDWSFEMGGINGPRRLQVIRAPAEWTLESILVSGIDVTDRPLAFGRRDQSLAEVEIVLTDRVTALSGTILDDRGQPARDAHVIVFPTDRDRWYPSSRFLRTTAARSDGSFRVVGLPGGSYYVAALAQVPLDGEDAWQDPELLDALTAGAATVTLTDGQAQALNLRLPAR